MDRISSKASPIEDFTLIRGGVLVLFSLLGLYACGAPHLNNACDPTDTEFAINQFVCLSDGASALSDAVGGGGGSNGAGGEIDITLNSAPLTSGGNIPTGNVSTGTTYDLIFTITNSGAGTLNLTGSPTIGLSGDTAQYSVLTQPGLTTLTSGQSTSFTIRYAPTTSFAHNAVLDVESDDTDEGSFQLNLAGTGQTGRFLMVGNTCVIRWHTNLTGAWSNGTTPGGCTDNLNSVAHGNDGASGKFVAVGDSGRIIVSTDRGINWTTATSGTGLNFLGVGHANGTWVAVGQTGTIRYTANPTGTWSTGTGGTGDLVSVAYGNGTWMAAGGGGNICTSTDAASWSCSTPHGAIAFSAVAFGNGNFVVAGAGGAIYATDNAGTSWNDNTTAGHTYKKATFGNGIFGITTDAFATTASFMHDPATEVQTGSNTFSDRPITPTNNPIFGGEVAFGNNIWVVAARGGPNDQVFFNSTANLAGAWTKNATGAIFAWNGITFED